MEQKMEQAIAEVGQVAAGIGEKVANTFDALDSQLTIATSLFGYVDKFFSYIFDGIFLASSPPPTNQSTISPPETETPKNNQVAVTEITQPLNLIALKNELKTELENYVRAQIDSASPIVVYSSPSSVASTEFQTFKTNEVIPTVRYSVMRQSDTDSSRASSHIGNLTDGGTFTGATLLTSTFSGSHVGTESLYFTNATGTSATTTNLYVSGLASTTDLRANTATIGNLTLLFTTFTNFLANGSSTLQNFTATNSTSTSATTTNFATSVFSVGQCVTGDTKLRRRRKKKGRDGENDEFEDARIDEIEEGDEILTLDDQTGRLKVSRVKKLAYMGNKPIVELTTALGKKIRTTANHPYLLQAKSELPTSKPKLAVFYDNSNMFYAQKKAGWKIDFKKLRTELSDSFDVKFINFYTAVPKEDDLAREATLHYLDLIKQDVILKTKPLKYIKMATGVSKKGDMDVEMSLDVTETIDQLDVIVVVSGDSDLMPLRRYAFEHRKKMVFLGFKHNMAWELTMRGKYMYLDDSEKVLAFGENKNSKPKLGVALLTLLYSHPPSVSSGGVWTKVSELKAGQKIAVLSDNGKPVWDEITELRELPAEDVYDVEVEGTHNFVGNGIIAHNTAFFANSSGFTATNSTSTSATTTNFAVSGLTSTRIPFTSTGGALIDSSLLTFDRSVGRLTTTYASTTQVQSTNDAYFATSGGKVGIGTAGPGAILDVRSAPSGSTPQIRAYSNSSSATSYGMFQALNSNADALMFSIGDRSYSPNTYYSHAGEAVISTSIDRALAINTNATNNNGLYIAISGNVGIGTTTPQWKTQISGTAAPQLTLSDSGLVTANHFSFRNSNGILYVATSSPTSFATSSTPQLTIDGTTGYVGIGTASPVVALDVTGSTALNGVTTT
ncbi:MAG: NYN domain-containing protein, partial [Candidatus Sungbacteria bacterium]|nr:NYN domain-containing protein [Candidatus Sungbacteria bacterium]